MVSDDKLWKSSERGSESALGVRQRFISTRPSSRTWSPLTQDICLLRHNRVSRHWFSSISAKCDRSPRIRVCRQPRELTGPRTRVDERRCTYVYLAYYMYNTRLLPEQRCLRNEIRASLLRGSNGVQVILPREHHKDAVSESRLCSKQLATMLSRDLKVQLTVQLQWIILIQVPMPVINIIHIENWFYNYY